MVDSTGHDDGYQCVEPELGQTLWRLDLPEIEPDEAELLRGHLKMCDACRLYRAMERGFDTGLADGSLCLGTSTEKPAQLPRRLATAPLILNWGAGLAIAASLALVTILPPEARDDGHISRSGTEAPFVRPVEGEVVGPDALSLSWRAIPGASRYLVRVEEVDGAFRWSTETRDLSVSLVDGAAAPNDKDLRAFVTPIPRDLAPAEGLSVSFRTGSTGDVVRHRLAASPDLPRAFALAGLLAGLGAFWLKRRSQ